MATKSIKSAPKASSKKASPSAPEYIRLALTAGLLIGDNVTYIGHHTTGAHGLTPDFLPLTDDSLVGAHGHIAKTDYSTGTFVVNFNGKLVTVPVICLVRGHLPINDSKIYIAASQMFAFKEGEYVKVLRKAITHERGWSNDWDSYSMDRMVGRVFKVIGEDGGSGVYLADEENDSHKRFPFFVLERAPKPISTVISIPLSTGQKAIISASKMKVGCQTIMSDAIVELGKALAATEPKKTEVKA